jgi:hypothetical protein
MFSDGKGLFAMASGMGFTYSLTSNTWANMSNSNFMGIRSVTATTDPESGIIYVLNNAADFSGTRAIFSFDIKTKDYNTTSISSSIDIDMAAPITWSSSLKSILFLQCGHSDNRGLHIYTPSKARELSNGWDMRVTTGETDWKDVPSCLVSAYGGSKIALFSRRDTQSAVYVLDLATLRWKKGPSIPVLTFATCAVSGDQFILWSGYSTSNDSISNKTIVYDMKNESWVLNYIVPSPSSPGRIALPSTTPSTQDTVPNPGDTSSTGEKPHVIVAIAIGVLLAISAALVFTYLRVTKRMKADGQNADDNERAPGSHERQRLHESGLFNWPLQGSAGRRRLLKHPHAVMDENTERRNVQEGAVEVELPLQHPHTMTDS